MPSNSINRKFVSQRGLSFFLNVKTLLLFLIVPVIILFHGCALFKTPSRQQALFSGADIENILKNVKEQETIATKFYFTGTLSIKGWIWDTTADILVAGIKNPFMFKIEVTHSWGKPLFYFLIDEDKLIIRDFIEKKQYTGRFTRENLSRFLPNMDCSPDMIWSLLRGYPYILSYVRIYEGNPGALNFEGRNGNLLGTITFSLGEGIKKAVSMPPRFPYIEYADFRKDGDIYYAENTVVEDVKGKKDMTIKRNKVVFNRHIPAELFTLKNDPPFEIIDLDRM